jgi:hypothetical protein
MFYSGKHQLFEYPEAELLQLKLIHLFACELLLMKKLEIEKTKPTFIISVLNVEY